jgi:hypothetical protein
MQSREHFSGSPFRHFNSYPPAFVPALFEEEEEEESGPDYDVLASWGDQNLVEAFKNWATSVRSKSYKFIALVLETSQTSLELKLNNHISENPDFYDVESGPDLLVVHNCSRFGPNTTIRELTRIASLWLNHLDIGRLALPAIVVLPHTKFSSHSKSGEEMMVYSFGDGHKHWDGSDADFFFITFRALFDAVDTVSYGDAAPIRTLRKEFRRSLSKSFGTTWMDKASSLVNLPVVGHIIKIIGML